ncbi:MAG: hypothetical protein KA184_09470 [Candidatus Hydrogenedentes bacterium]|nr:hypothetical protein [Candidatus Hydrogenedentota bacterium]
MSMFTRRRLVIAVFLFPVAVALVARSAGNGIAAPEDGPFTEAFLNGGYRAHDLFGLLDGSAAIAYGVRDFDGEGQLVSLVSYASRSPLSYVVAPNGRFRLFGDDFEGTYTGTVGFGGGGAFYSRRAAAGADAQVLPGYAALRVSVESRSGWGDGHFNGVYAYHALIRERTAVWRNVIGTATADGAGGLALARPGMTVTLDYDVASDGRVAIGPQGRDFASLAEGGALVFHTPDLGSGEDPLYANGYLGLAIYVREAAGLTTGDFSGTYRVHELRIGSGGSNTADVGSITAGGNGVFFGALGSRAYSGRIELESTGAFRFRDAAENRGALGAGGDFAVVSRNGGLVQHGAGEARLHCWVRTAGGGPLPNDADGDGVRNDVETAQGSNSNNRDTDGDGLLDNADARPLTPDNTFTATLAQSVFTVTEGGASPAPATLTLYSDDFPFFDWSVAADASWVTIAPAHGEGDATASVSINTTGFTSANSPYHARLHIATPYMRPHADLDITVNVLGPPVRVNIAPASLTFYAVQGQQTPTAGKSTAISSPDTSSFAWSAAKNAAWISVSPGSGTGPGVTSVAANPAGLTAAGSPYTGVVTFTADGSSAAPAVLTVTLYVLPPREPGVPFRVAPSALSQGSPTIAAGDGLYVLAWAQSNIVQAATLDAQGVPVVEPVPVSLAAQGPAANPVTAINAMAGKAWVVWEQRLAEGGQPLLQGREFEIAAGGPGPLFGVAGGTQGCRAASLCFDPERNAFAVAYERAGDNTDVLVAVFDAATREKRYEVVPAATERDEGMPCIALDAARNAFLLAWSEEFTTTEDAPQARILAQRISAADGAASGAPLAIDESPGLHEAPRLAYDAVSDVWNVLWRWRAPETDTSTYGMRLARFAAGAPAVTVVGVSEAPASSAGHDVAFAPASEQLMPVWSGGEGTRRVFLRRYTAAGFALRGIEAFPGDAGDAYAPRLAHEAGSPESMAAWVDERDGLAQIYGMRIAAGSTDEDDDGLPNDWELEHGLDPLDGTGDDGAAGDPDGDGLGNLEEFVMGTDPHDEDSDQDGLWDRQEDRNRDGAVTGDETNPLAADTDADGFEDAAEWFLGSNGNSAGATPRSGIARLEYGAFPPGEPGALRVHIAAAQAGSYTLGLNTSTPLGWKAPEGWTAALDGAQTVALTPGSHVFQMEITAEEPVRPAADHGSFVFRLTGPDVDQTRTAILVADVRSTQTGTDVPADALASDYAPVIRLHREEFYRPVPVELPLSLARLDLGNSEELRVAPDALDLYQSPQSEARVDLVGTSLQQLRDNYPGPSAQPEPVVYYTVATVDNYSSEPAAPEKHVVVQYYLLFHADEWGRNVLGGHRHEGDWEMVQVLFDDALEPYRVTATQRREVAIDLAISGGASAAWDAVERMGGTHPVMYAGQGGHSLYFRSGATRYYTGLEVHDGLGEWMLPRAADAPLVETDYPRAAPLRLEPIARLGEAGVRPWQRFAGLWGQRDFPPDPTDRPSPSGRNGAPGPAFLGDSDVPVSATLVRSCWTDPYAWAQRANVFGGERTTHVTARLPQALAARTALLADARGRVYRAPVQPDGRFETDVPSGNYVLCVVTEDETGYDVLEASAVFDAPGGPTMLFPTYPGGVTDLGPFALSEGRLSGSDIYGRTDSDGDGFADATDADQDNDGTPNLADADALGDGFADAYQTQDPDGDFVPFYFEDDAASPDSGAPADSDGDGFIDACDLDIDNDGYTNAEEEAAETDPRHFFDNPEERVGDVDRDGEIDAVDLQRLVNMALGAEAVSPRGDFDRDGAIQAYDLQRAVLRVLEVGGA